jgi:hypothetical protein
MVPKQKWTLFIPHGVPANNNLINFVQKAGPELVRE